MSSIETEEIKQYIENKYCRKLEKHLSQKIEVNDIIFEKGSEGSPEGTYVFYDTEGYHYLFTERGQIGEHVIENNIDHIAYKVMDKYVFDIALKYATQNREQNKDFRKNLFDKQKEIWLFLDKNYYLTKTKEINKILRENPYNDSV